MDIFQPGIDPFCTIDGTAQNRMPSDLSQAAVQQGTVLTADMVNGIVFELVNAIKMLGENPDRQKVNQLATGLTNALYGQQVGQVRRWACDSAHVPAEDAILLGGEIDPSDYVDELATLKERCPDWVQPSGKIKLPNYNRYYGVMDIARAVGDEQQDAMQNWTQKFSMGNQSEGNASVGSGHITSGAPVSQFNLSSVARTADETRPRNINEIHTVTVGKPKERKNPQKFYLLDEQGTPTGQQITLYQGASGAYMGFNATIMSTTYTTAFNIDQGDENAPSAKAQKIKKGGA